MLLGRFTLIFYFNCEHVRFVYILKQKPKSSWIFKIFRNLMKIEVCWRQIFENLIIHKHMRSHIK